MKISTTIVHLIFLIFFLSLPVWPEHLMYIVRWFPVGLTVIWFIFNGCPLTKIDKSLDDQTFTEAITKPLLGDIGKERIIALTYILLIVVTILCNAKYYNYIYNN